MGSEMCIRDRDVRLTEEAARKAREYNQTMLELNNELQEVKYNLVELGSGPAQKGLQAIGRNIEGLSNFVRDPKAAFSAGNIDSFLRGSLAPLIGAPGGTRSNQREKLAPPGVMGGGGPLPRDFWAGARAERNNIQMTNYFTIDGASSPQETGDMVVGALNEKLSTTQAGR